MYSQYLEVKQSKNSLGLFSKVEIPANSPIAEATGKVLTINELPDPKDPIILQVGPNTYMMPSGKFIPDYINHSCNPNCYFNVVGNRAILFSLYVIPPNSELTFDYSTTSTESPDQWKMNCNCGHNKCRKEISGFQHMDKLIQDHYKSKNILPIYIMFPIIQPR